MPELGVRVEQELSEYVSARKVPIDHLLVTATTSGGAQTLYTVRARAMMAVKSLRAANITASAATLTMHSIPSGGSLATANTEFAGLSIPANTIADLTDYIAGLYTEGTVLKAYSDTGSAIILHGWGEEVL